LLFATDDAGQVKDLLVFDMRIGNVVDEVGITFGEQERVLRVDVGDKQAGEGETFFIAQFLQGLCDGLGVIPEVSETELFKWRSGKANAFLVVDCEMRASDAVRRVGESDRA